MFENALIYTDDQERRWEAVAEDANGYLVCVPLNTPVLRLDVNVPTEDEQNAVVEETPEA